MDALDGVFADITNPLEADADVLRRSFVLSDSAAELVLQQQEGEEEQEREEEEDHKDEEKEKKDEQELDKQDGENEPEEQGQEDEDKTEEPEEPSNVGSSPEVASGDQLFSSDMDLSAIPNDDTHVHDLLPGTDADTAALPTDVFGPDQAAAVSSLGTTVDLGANVEGGQDESGLSASSETGGDDTAEDSTELALTDTESRLTRSGQSYSTVPTACSTSTELCDRRKRQLEALQQRTAKSRRTTLQHQYTRSKRCTTTLPKMSPTRSKSALEKGTTKYLTLTFDFSERCMAMALSSIPFAARRWRGRVRFAQQSRPGRNQILPNFSRCAESS